VIMIASTVSCLRVLAAIAVVSPDFFLHAFVPVAVVTLLTFAPGLAMWYGSRHQPGIMPDHENPTQLKSAVVFGVMYALVLFALAAAEQYLGGQGLFMVAGLSGLTEMDAITLSTAKMSLQDSSIMTHTGWQMVVVAIMANMVSKTALAGILGGQRLLWRMTALFSIPMIGGAAMIWLW
jgi:uncharacterized membrane protein (DUF4010 family)